MAKVKFIDEDRPNKQLIMNRMYYFASERLHHVDAVILPSTHPFRPLRRLYRYGITGLNTTVQSWEFDKNIYNNWTQSVSKKKTNFLNAIARLAKYYHISKNQHSMFLGNIVDSNNVAFKDLDFCATWLGTKDIKKGMNDPLSPFNIIKQTIKNQKKLDTKWKTVLVTISLRGGSGGKATSYKLLSAIVKEAGSSLLSIDGLTDSYSTGKEIGNNYKKNNKQGGVILYAHEHTVQLKTDNVHMALFTYRDKLSMLSFAITHK